MFTFNTTPTNKPQNRGIFLAKIAKNTQLSPKENKSYLIISKIEQIVL